MQGILPKNTASLMKCLQIEKRKDATDHEKNHTLNVVYGVVRFDAAWIEHGICKGLHKIRELSADGDMSSIYI